jgi:hypothetical protein
MNAVVTWLGLSASHKWHIRPLIVVDRELFAPYLRTSKIAVMSYYELTRVGLKVPAARTPLRVPSLLSHYL